MSVSWEALCEDIQLCALCGCTALGYARGPGGEALCHSSVRDCYHRWTVWGQRPGEIEIGIPVRVGAER